jgi:hypothetical protein
MFWTGLFVGFAACLFIGLGCRFIYDWRQRMAFLASLSGAERERLYFFESVKGDWHEFRDTLHRCSYPSIETMPPSLRGQFPPRT